MPHRCPSRWPSRPETHRPAPRDLGPEELVREPFRVVRGDFVEKRPNPTGPDLCASASQGLSLVEGAGFEPATSGSIQASADDHRSDSRSTCADTTRSDTAGSNPQMLPGADPIRTLNGHRIKSHGDRTYVPSEAAVAYSTHALTWLPSVSRHLGECGLRLVVDGSRSGLFEESVLGL